tara:strand:- start:698 stop:1024 length:327 start_codon:yes stop_codon:yes gene_type:complete
MDYFVNFVINKMEVNFNTATLYDLEYYGNIQLCTDLVKKWIKLKPNNKELQALNEALFKVSIYIAKTQSDLKTYKDVISDYRYKKNKALLELEELQTKYEHYIIKETK